MGDIKYFATTKRGEIPELRQELMDENKRKRIGAMKKVIANMTLNNDMSSLFPEVLSCMTNNSLELKKMVYLYLINYARTKPDLALMAVNTFIRDAEDPNPLIRGLAIRTMGYIQVDKITDAMCEPLRRGLRDRDPYVRKTAALCVAKLYAAEKNLVEDQGFLDTLRDMIHDSNSMVVANVFAALMEISTRSDTPLNVAMTMDLVNRLLTALNECNEWGQVYLLEAIMLYKPRNSQEAEIAMERVAPRLNHSNSAVVLSAVKVLMHFMPYLDADEKKSAFARRMGSPLITLLRSGMPEVQYVALRNILLLIQKRVDVIPGELKVFFCEYNDPIYVKLAKLEVMMLIVNDKNVEFVLSELKEYASEIDVDFVRKAVRLIGLCAIKVERSADRCIEILLELIQTKVNYVVQEAIVVIRDIFRKFPNRYESIIGVMCENLDTLDEPEAKASMIWIIGQYAERIDNAHELISTFLDSFMDEPLEVQYALLTATVKLFLKRPNDAEQMIKKVFKWVTEDVDNPDLRDRGFIYWRLLSTDPRAAKAIILSDRPVSAQYGTQGKIDPMLLDELLAHIGTLASVYHKPPSAFLQDPRYRKLLNRYKQADVVDENRETANGDAEHAGGAGGNLANQEDSYGAMPPANQVSVGGGMMNLLDLDEAMPGGSDAAGGGSDVLSNTLGQMGLGDLEDSNNLGSPSFGIGELLGLAVETPAAVASVVLPKQMLLAPQQGKGLEIYGTFARRSGKISLEMTFSNRAMQPMGDFAIQFNTNSFGLAAAAPLQIRSPLLPNTSADTTLPLALSGVPTPRDPYSSLQIAVKNNVGVFYLSTPLPGHILFAEDGALERSEYLSQWREIPDEVESRTFIPGLSYASAEAITNKLNMNNIFTVAQRDVDAQILFYCSAKVQPSQAVVLMELSVDSTLASASCAVRTSATQMIDMVAEAVKAVLQHH